MNQLMFVLNLIILFKLNKPVYLNVHYQRRSVLDDKEAVYDDFHVQALSPDEHEQQMPLEVALSEAIRHENHRYNGQAFRLIDLLNNVRKASIKVTNTPRIAAAGGISSTRKLTETRTSVQRQDLVNGLGLPSSSTQVAMTTSPVELVKTESRAPVVDQQVKKNDLRLGHRSQVQNSTSRTRVSMATEDFNAATRTSSRSKPARDRTGCVICDDLVNMDQCATFEEYDYANELFNVYCCNCNKTTTADNQTRPESDVYGNNEASNKPVEHENANLMVLVLLTVAITVLVGIFVLLAIMCARSRQEVSDIKIYATPDNLDQVRPRPSKPDEEDSSDPTSDDGDDGETDDKLSLKTIPLEDPKDDTTTTSTSTANGNNPTSSHDHHHPKAASSSTSGRERSKTAANGTRTSSSSGVKPFELSPSSLPNDNGVGLKHSRTHHERACDRDQGQSAPNTTVKIYKRFDNPVLGAPPSQTRSSAKH